MTRDVRIQGPVYDEPHHRIFINVDLVGLVNPRARAYITRDQALDLIRSLAAVLQIEEQARMKAAQRTVTEAHRAELRREPWRTA